MHVTGTVGVPNKTSKAGRTFSQLPVARGHYLTGTLINSAPLKNVQIGVLTLNDAVRKQLQSKDPNNVPPTGGYTVSFLLSTILGNVEMGEHRMSDGWHCLTRESAEGDGRPERGGPEAVAGRYRSGTGRHPGERTRRIVIRAASVRFAVHACYVRKASCSKCYVNNAAP